MNSEPPAKREFVREKDIRALHARLQKLEDKMTMELDKKKDTKVSDLEIEQLKQTAGKHDCSQVTKIALMTSSMASIQRSVLNIEGSLNKWRVLKLGGVLAIALAVISGAAYIIRTDSKTEAVQTSVDRIEKDVTDMKTKVTDMKTKVNGAQQKNLYAETRALAEIRRAIKEEMAKGP